MNVLLINSNRFKLRPVIPFGLCCVASAVKKAGYKVRVLDLLFVRNCEQSIARAIAEFQPEVLGISIRNIDNAGGYHTQFFLERIKDEVIFPCKQYFSGPIVIGGSAVGISGAEMLCYFDAPYALQGDGDIAMVEFLERIEQHIPLHGLNGLICQEDGRVFEENPPAIVHNLDALPFTQGLSQFINMTQYRRYNVRIPIQTKRGCPLKCIYCTYNRIEGTVFRLRAPQSVADEIETIVKQTGIHSIEFTDSIFNLPLHHTKAVLRAIIEKNLSLDLRTMGVNPGAVDEELVELMKNAGFSEVDLGTESCCDTILENLGKNFRTHDVLNAADLFHQQGISIGWFLLAGAPGEDENTLQKTFRTLEQARSKRDLVYIGMGVRVYKGSPIAEIVQTDDPNCTTDNFLYPVCYTSHIDLEHIKNIVRYHASKKGYIIYNDIDYDQTSPRRWGIWEIIDAIWKTVVPLQPEYRLYGLYTVYKQKIKDLWMDARNMWRN